MTLNYNPIELILSGIMVKKFSKQDEASMMGDGDTSVDMSSPVRSGASFSILDIEEITFMSTTIGAIIVICIVSLFCCQ